PLTTPIPPLPSSSEASPITTEIPDPLPSIVQRLSYLENKFKAWSKVDHYEAIENLVQTNIINEVKNQLPKFIPKVVSDVVNLRVESIVYDALQKNQTLELKRILVDKMDKRSSYMTHDKHQDLYNDLLNSLCLDEAIASGSTSKGRTLSKPSKTGKSVNAKETVKAPAKEVTMDVEENIIDDMVNNDDQPQDDVPNTDKFPWFKQPSRPYTPDP
nr:hypothetical protein [Tanacetum cinerariifolium]